MMDFDKCAQAMVGAQQSFVQLCESLHACDDYLDDLEKMGFVAGLGAMQSAFKLAHARHVRAKQQTEQVGAGDPAPAAERTIRHAAAQQVLADSTLDRMFTNAREPQRSHQGDDQC